VQKEEKGKEIRKQFSLIFKGDIAQK